MSWTGCRRSRIGYTVSMGWRLSRKGCRRSRIGYWTNRIGFRTSMICYRRIRIG
jgi:hypothetical protein